MYIQDFIENGFLGRSKMNNLLFNVENEIGVITINRPKALNALNSETLSELK